MSSDNNAKSEENEASNEELNKKLLNKKLLNTKSLNKKSLNILRKTNIMCGSTRLKKIANGSFGTIYKKSLVNDKKKESVIKIVSVKDKIREAQVFHEIKCHGIVSDHPNIVSITGFQSGTTKAYIELEYAENGCLFDLIKVERKINKFGECKMPEDQVKDIFLQLIDAVDYCHQQGVVHRDIKLENVLLDGDNRPLLADFGYSRTIGDDGLIRGKVGTKKYMPPEIFDIEIDKINGIYADIWSCGIMLYVMLFCNYPFIPSVNSDIGKKTHLKMMNFQYAWSPVFSSDAIDLLVRIFQPNPEDRLSISEIRKHAYFTGSWGTDEMV